MMATIWMIKTAAGPEGTWHIGKKYQVPKEMPLKTAQKFVKRLAGRWIEKPERAVAKRTNVETADARPEE